MDLLEMGLRGPLTEEQQVDLSRIKQSQQYLLGLIEQVLVFTQLEAHRIAIHLQDVGGTKRQLQEAPGGVLPPRTPRK